MRRLQQMQTALLLAAAFFMTACGGGQPSDQSEEKDSFKDLGENAEFREKHDEPGELEDGDLRGEMISYAVKGGEQANAYAITNENSDRYLLVFHEWWGLNDYIKREADRWHEKLNGINVIAIDLYDGKVAQEKEKAQEYMQSADEKRLQAIIEASLGRIPENATIGTIGWCFGGGWSLKAAIAAGERAEACVMFYGMPVTDVEKLKKIEADVLFIYGKKDKWINEKVANQFAENMKKTDEDVIIKGFDADHAFANPSQESYNEEAAQTANAMALEFLIDELLEDEDDLDDDEDKDDREEGGDLIKQGTDPADYENEAENADGTH